MYATRAGASGELTILKDGSPYLGCWPGGTGPCWNIRVVENSQEGYDEQIHVCELDELIGALQALRASAAHQENVKRWSTP
jgi:hypothetical protein